MGDQINFVVGKSYRIRLNWSAKPLKVYIDHILPSIYDGEELIIYRVWLKHKGYWLEEMCTKTKLNMYLSITKELK